MQPARPPASIHAIRAVRVLTLAVALALAACGGDGGGDARPTGTLAGAPANVAELSSAQLDAAAARVPGLSALAGAATCGVRVSRVRYEGTGGRGEATQSAAAVMVPTGTNPACTGARPLVMYAHGTAPEREKDMANVAGDTEAALVAGMLAAQGWVVVAPNYQGYAGSTLPYHPYLNAQAQSADALDAIRAARAAAPALGVTLSPRVYLTGYSQGGHVAMATQRAIQNGNLGGEFQVAAGAPLSGPYALASFGADLVGGRVNQGATIFVPMLIESYQRSYGDIYAQPSEVYQSPFDAIVPNLFPVTGLASTQALFTPTAANPVPRLPLALFDPGNGTPFLVRTSFRDDVRNNPANAFRVALGRNDLTDWAPTAPMLLCGGSQDTTVFFNNSTRATTNFINRGVNVPLVDLENTAAAQATLGAGGAAIATAFQQTRAANPTADYHGLVAPFCLRVARDFFASRP